MVWLLPVHKKTVEASLTLKNYIYERETPKYRVYKVNFAINNTGNQSVTLIQAIPFDPNDKSLTLNFLQNNNCESYKDITIEGGKFQDFTMHLFVPKDTIEFAKNSEQYNDKQYSIVDSQTGEKIKPMNSFVKFEIVAKVLIFGADNKYRGAISAPFDMPYSKGEEYSGGALNIHPFLPKSINFEERNEYFYKCPIKEIAEQ